MKLGEAIYKAEAERQAQAEASSATPGSPDDDGVVDADFEDIGDDKKK
jgi:molecular chaperone DnaK